MDSMQSILSDDHIIAFYDIDNFTGIAKKYPGEELFSLINTIHTQVIEKLADLDPVVIKNQGDSDLIILKKERVDEKVSALYSLKDDIEALLGKAGFSNSVSFSCHYGEIIVGNIGTEPFVTVDAFGEAINVAFLMNGRPFRGRFSISPQLFRKLGSESRKLFHKFTPQIVYLAD